MASPDFHKKIKRRLIILVIILLIIFGIATLFLSEPTLTFTTYLDKVFNPQISSLIIIAFPFCIALVLSFLPEVFGEYVKIWLFGKDEDEKEEKPPDTQLPVINQNKIPEQKQTIVPLISQVPTDTTSHNGKFYPKEFLPDLSYFVGRQKLFKDIEKFLGKTHRVSIHDISGLGKTFSTLKYADLHKDSYDKIFFINASKETYLESLAECGVLLEPSVASAQEQAVKANAFKNWLEKNDNWLVIFDNVDIAQDIKPFVPTNLKGDCLFTSNFRDARELGTEVKIEKLSEIESKMLLFSRANSRPQQKPTFEDQTEAEAFEKIIAEIDGLPISLTTTGAFIAKKQISFVEYLERLDDEPEIILEAEDGFDNYHKKSALKAFSIAFEANTDTKDLDAYQTQLAEAVKLLYFVASLLYPEDIPAEFLRAYLQKYYEPFTQSAKPNAFWQDVRAKFTEYDLFKWNPNNKTFWTHRLIQKTIQTKLDNDEKEAICRNVLELLGDYFPKYDYNNKESCERYYQHTVFALENADKSIESEDSVWLFHNLGEYQRFLGNYQQAEVFHKTQVTISKVVFESNNYNTVLALSCLGLVQQHQSKYDEAIELFQEALEIGQKVFGIHHSNYATCLNNLALPYHSQGNYDKAIKLYKEALEIGKKTIGIEHPIYAVRLNNLGSAYRYQGKNDEAIKLFQEALEITKNTFGTEHPDYAMPLNNLAFVYLSQSKYDVALPLYEEALRIYEAKLPVTHPDIQGIRESLKRCKEALEKESKTDE